MITEEEYKTYFGADTAPSNFKRKEYLSLKEFESIMVDQIPANTCPCYEDFKKAVMEQINYFDENQELMQNDESTNYSLGKYSEGSKEKTKTDDTMKRISPMAYNILLACGFLNCSIGRC